MSLQKHCKTSAMHSKSWKHQVHKPKPPPPQSAVGITPPGLEGTMQKSVVSRIFSVCFRKQSFLADYIKYISFLLLRCNIISSGMINLFSWTSIFSTHSSNLMIKWSLACCCAFTGCFCHGLCYYFSEIFIIWGWEWSSTAGHLLSTAVVLHSIPRTKTTERAQETALLAAASL